MQDAFVDWLRPEDLTHTWLFGGMDTSKGRVDLWNPGALLDLAPDAILVRALARGEIRFWNRGAEALDGWNKAEARGVSSHTLLQARFPRPLPELKPELAATGHWEGEVEHHTRDDRRLTVASRWSSVATSTAERGTCW